MDDSQLFTKGSKIFFIIFFSAVAIAVGAAYYRYEILKDFHSYTDSEEIPRAVDFYVNILNKLQ